MLFSDKVENDKPKAPDKVEQILPKPDMPEEVPVEKKDDTSNRCSLFVSLLTLLATLRSIVGIQIASALPAYAF